MVKAKKNYGFITCLTKNTISIALTENRKFYNYTAMLSGNEQKEKPLKGVFATLFT